MKSLEANICSSVNCTQGHVQERLDGVDSLWLPLFGSGSVTASVVRVHLVLASQERELWSQVAPPIPAVRPWKVS